MGCLCRENVGELAGVVGIAGIGGRPGGEEGILPTLSETQNPILPSRACVNLLAILRGVRAESYGGLPGLYELAYV